MKTVILCGGKGSRILEMTDVIPKPMLPVGEKPLLGHIIDIYRHYEMTDFLLPLGYRRDYILAYLLSLSPYDMTSSNGISHFVYPDYEVTAVNTGDETQIGGRLLRVQDLLDEPFNFTYGDGLSDVNLSEVMALYSSEVNLATLTLVHPEGRFGRAVLNADGKGEYIIQFGEKTETSDWINGGFSILHPDIFSFIKDDMTNLERDVYPTLAGEGLMLGYKHEGFWRCVDTKRDLLELESIYMTEGAKWLKHS